MPEYEPTVVDAKPERLMQVTAPTAFDLLKAAYHLGNRHVPLMLTPTALYFEPDHVLAEMVMGLGLTVAEIDHRALTRRVAALVAVVDLQELHHREMILEHGDLP